MDENSLTQRIGWGKTGKATSMGTGLVTSMGAGGGGGVEDICPFYSTYYNKHLSISATCYSTICLFLLAINYHCHNFIRNEISLGKLQVVFGLYSTVMSYNFQFNNRTHQSCTYIAQHPNNTHAYHMLH